MSGVVAGAKRAPKRKQRRVRKAAPSKWGLLKNEEAPDVEKGDVGKLLLR